MCSKEAMATPAVPSLAVLDLAFGGLAARDVAMAAERHLLARRATAPDTPAACAEALTAAAGPPGGTAAERCAIAIAEAVERHGAAFATGMEPAYHDRHHQAEAVLAMGWLAGVARRRGLIGAHEARLGVAAMAGHDLLHDGSAGGARGVLEQRSADVSAEIAAAAGLDAEDIATIRHVIRATTWPWEDAEAPDLLCRLAREADLFGSAMPRLGPMLARRLVRELAAAGQQDAASVASHMARLGLLRLLAPATPPAEAIGLEATRARQVAAYGAVARALGVAPPTADAGAAALDAMDEADAAALLAHAEAGA